MKHHNQKHLGEQWIYLAYTSTSLSIKEGSQDVGVDAKAMVGSLRGMKYSNL